MTPEKRSDQLLQLKHQLDYQLHSCQQTLYLLQISGSSGEEMGRNLIQEQEQLYQQLQAQYEDVTRRLST